MPRHARPLVVLALLLSAASARAESVVLPHQGRLFDAANRPVDGSIDMSVSLWATDTDSSPAWTQSFPGTQVVAGVYSLLLGDDGSTPLDAATIGRSRWLSVSIGGSELLPRLRVGTVAFAAIAEEAGRLGGRTAADYVTKDDAALLATKEEVNACLLKSEATALLTNGALADYAKLTDLAPYAKTTDLAPYAKTIDLAPYVKLGDLTPYAKTSDLTPFAKTADLAPYAKTTDVASNYLPKDGVPVDTRNVLEHGGFEAWRGLWQNFGWDNVTASRYLPQLPIGWTATNNGIDPSAAMTSWLTTGRTVSRQTDTPAEGAAYARLTFPSASRDAGVELSLPALAVEPNRAYTLSFQVRVQAGTNVLNDLVVTAAGTTFTVANLTSSWARVGPFTFTTGATTNAVALTFRPRGLGGTVDLDAVGLWRGGVAGETADPRGVCPSGMVNAGEYCIEPTNSVVFSVDYMSALHDCGNRGRRMCSPTELTYAARMGVISSAAPGQAGLWWVWSGVGFDGGYFAGFNPCHVQMGRETSYWTGDLNCQLQPSSAQTDVGRLCCKSR